MVFGGNKFFSQEQIDDMHSFLINCHCLMVPRTQKMFQNDLQYFVKSNKFDNNFTDDRPGNITYYNLVLMQFIPLQYSTVLLGLNFNTNQLSHCYLNFI